MDDKNWGDSSPDQSGTDEESGCFEGGGEDDDENQKLMMDNNNGDQQNKMTVSDPDSDADKDVKSVKAIDYYEKMLKVKWNEDQIVWDLGQIQWINKNAPERKGLPEIKIVKRYTEMEMGIRAHPEMNAWKCIKSMFMAWHAEFTTIWLYLAFAVYFWVNIYLIAIHDDWYGYKQDEYYTYMLIVTLAIAVSLSITTAYIIFYPISEETLKTFEYIDFLGILIMIAVITCILLVAELAPSPIQFGDLTLLQIMIIIVASFFFIMLILALFKSLQNMVFWLVLAFLLVIFFVDFFFITSHEQVKNFWIPFFIFLALLAIAALFVFFTFPQRLCNHRRESQLFLQSHFWYSLAYVLLLFVIHYGLKNMFKYDDQVVEDRNNEQLQQQQQQQQQQSS